MQTAGIFDTHCHLILLKDLHGAVLRALEQNVCSLLDVSVGLSGFIKRNSIIGQLLMKFPHLSINLTAGIPPYFCDKRMQGDIDKVRLQAEKEKKVVAIGEIGLDYYHNYGTRSQQIDLFVEQIDLANQLSLPVVVHTRDSDRDLIGTLKSHRLQRSGIIHCFSSDRAAAKLLLDLGFYISFAGNITYKKSGHIRAAARLVPDDRYLIETDSPYLSPEGFRGSPNEPAFITATASSLARIRGISFEEIVRQTAENAERLISAPDFSQNF